METIMHVSLTALLTSRVKEKVESGLYNYASEVIGEALWLNIQQPHHSKISNILLIC